MSILIILFGSDKYNASVVVGYTSGGKLVFYDMIDLNPANFIITYLIFETNFSSLSRPSFMFSILVA